MIIFNILLNVRFIFILLAFVALFPAINPAQDIFINLKVTGKNQVEISGKFNKESASIKNWSFLQDYADVVSLADKIQNLELFDANHKKINLKKFNSGEYVAEQKPASFNYQVNLAPAKKITDAAHSSWLTENGGILMLADLLPEFESENIFVDFDLPDTYKIAHPYPLLQKIEPTDFNIEKAVFLVGKNWREKELEFSEREKKSVVRVALVGDQWNFSDEEAVAMTKSIVEEYIEIFGQLPSQLSQIIISPFPQENVNPDRWRAETRGSTVTVISGVLPYKSQALQRLHEQLRHEIFHLWQPNALSLTGNFDWFYEGFTIYQALRSGLELNQIRFEDFLNTLSKAYDISEGQTDSLVQASSRRWLGSGNFVNAKGLVVAFLCDMTVMEKSKGKKSLKNIFAEIYREFKIPASPIDGNEAILKTLKSFPELNSIVQNYISGNSKIDWSNNLKMLGIEQQKDNFGVQLKVSSKLNGRQKDLLDKLGYNQWRKTLQKTK